MEKERRIEKLLRAFAKKRKADASAPLELHPATRRLLQDEVARTAKKSGREGMSLWQILFGTTPRRAFAVSALASLIVTAVLLLPALHKSNPSMTLAGNRRETTKEFKKAEPVAPQVSAPAPAATPAQESFADREDLKSKTDLALDLDSLVVTNAFAPVVAFDDAAGRVDGGSGGGGGGGNLNGDLPALRKNQSDALTLGGTGGTSKMEAENSATFALTESSAVNGFKDAMTTTGDVTANRDAASVTWSTSATTRAFESGKPPSTILADAGISGAPPTGTALNFQGGANGARFENLDKSKAPVELATQKFYRLRTAKIPEEAPASRQKPASAGEVLDSFAVEQDGDKIMVVDNDGSKYSGFVQLAAANDESISTVQKQRFGSAPASTATPARRLSVATQTAAEVAPSGSPSPVEQNYFFRVTGTNRSLNQIVVFSGNFITITNNVALVNGGKLAMATNAPGAFQFETKDQSSLLLNSRIEGKASVGNKSAIEINAVPAKP